VVLVLPACFLPFFIFSKYSVAFLAFIPLAPFMFTGLLWISPSRVRWFKLFLFIPYWVRHVPADGRFSIYEAMGDPGPSGVAFESDSHLRFIPTGYCIHIGTARSAAALFLYIGTALKQSGWNETWRGWQKTPISP
jgi:hypothetical protein